jgi:eukaryotic-like serine/threonine-protein kinase
VFKFITGKSIWVNILVGIVIAIVLLILLLQSLDWITRHGSTLTIPAVTGKSFEQAKQLLNEKGFEVEIQDSVYNDTAAPLAVLRQFPDADAVVKINRTVYLTINRAVPPVIEMPNLEGLSFRSAEIAIKQYGLKLEDTLYRPDFAKNSVLEQQHEGQRIKAGTKLAMGSSIVLILGSGLGEEEFAVPDLFGLSLSDAKVYLESSGLNLGTILPDDQRSNPNAFVYQQRPERNTPDGRVNRIRQGQSVDIWLQTEKPVRDTSGAAPPATNPY